MDAVGGSSVAVWLKGFALRSNQNGRPLAWRTATAFYWDDSVVCKLWFSTWDPHWDKIIRSLEIRNTPFGNSSDDYMVMKWVSCLNQGFPHFDHVPNWERRCPIAVTWTMILLWGDCLVHAAISRFGSINILMKRSSFSIRSKVYPDLVGQSVDDVTV